MENPALKLKVILGSTRPNRFSEKAGAWILEEARKRQEFETELLDLREYPMPFYDQPISPSQVKDGAYQNDIVKQWAAKIKEADAFVIVTPEYNHSTSGVLKNALDSVYAEWNNKAIGFVAYGSAGGARAVEHLRGIAVELQMAPIRMALHIRDPWTILDETGSLKPGALDPYAVTAARMLEQLLKWGAALRSAREE